MLFAKKDKNTCIFNEKNILYLQLDSDLYIILFNVSSPVNKVIQRGDS